MDEAQIAYLDDLKTWLASKQASKQANRTDEIPRLLDERNNITYLVLPIGFTITKSTSIQNNLNVQNSPWAGLRVNREACFSELPQQCQCRFLVALHTTLNMNQNSPTFPVLIFCFCIRKKAYLIVQVSRCRNSLMQLMLRAKTIYVLVRGV